MIRDKRPYISLGSYTSHLSDDGIKKGGTKKKKNTTFSKCIDWNVSFFDLDLISLTASTTLTYCTAHDKREMGHRLTDLTAYLLTFCYFLAFFLSSSFLISKQILFWVSFLRFCFVSFLDTLLFLSSLIDWSDWFMLMLMWFILFMLW